LTREDNFHSSHCPPISQALTCEFKEISEKDFTLEGAEISSNTSKISRELDMKVELAASAGWNMGGSRVSVEDASFSSLVMPKKFLQAA